MISGLLWFDDDPRKDTGRKIGEAAERYTLRFGVAPTVCRVHCPAQDTGPGAPPPALTVSAPSPGRTADRGAGPPESGRTTFG